MQSKVVPAAPRAPRRRVATPTISTSSLASSCVDALALARVVLDDQHAAQALRELRFELLQRLHQLLALDRLQRIADGAQLERLAGCSRPPRRRAPECAACCGLRLSWSSTPRPEWSGRFMSSRIALGRYASRRLRGLRGRCAATMHWKPISRARSRRIAAKRASSSITRMSARVGAQPRRDRRRRRWRPARFGIEAGRARGIAVRLGRRRRAALRSHRGRAGGRGVGRRRARSDRRGSVSVNMLPRPARFAR